MSGEGDLLDELKAAHATRQLSAEGLARTVTTGAANLLRVPGAGRLAAGAPADLTIVRPLAPCPFDSLVSAGRADLRMTMIDGQPCVAEPALAPAFLATGVPTMSARVDGNAAARGTLDRPARVEDAAAGTRVRGPLMVGPGEIARRARGRVTGRLESLPILALSVHSACNCRCVMCDIWKANAEKREISPDDLSRHVEAIRALRVQRVMLTGGEPLLHRNLWALCSELQALRHPHHAGHHRTADRTARRGRGVVCRYGGDLARWSASMCTTRIRRVKGGFDRIAKGVMALRAQQPAPRLIARTVVQRDNAAAIDAIITAAHRMGFDEISFLAADVSSPAFNRPEPWSAGRIAEIAVAESTLAELELSIDRAVAAGPELFDGGFVAGGRASLDRIVQYYRALAGGGAFPGVQCNAPWVSAVLEPGDVLRPCFFQPAYASSAEGLEAALNSETRDRVSPRPRRRGQRHVPALRVLAQPAVDVDGLTPATSRYNSANRSATHEAWCSSAQACAFAAIARARDGSACNARIACAIDGASIVSIASARSAAQSATYPTRVPTIGKSCSRGFEHRNARRLVQRRLHVEVGVSEDRCESILRREPEEPHAIGDASSLPRAAAARRRACLRRPGRDAHRLIA